MPQLLLRFVQFQNQFQKKLGAIIAWGSLSLVILAASVVFFRYGLNFGSIALQEAVLYNHAILLMLGMSYTFLLDKHVRVDIFYAQMNAKGKAWINLLGNLFLALPTMIFILWSSKEYIFNSWRVMETSAEYGGLAYVFLLKSLIWVMAILFLLQVISAIVEAALIVFFKEKVDIAPIEQTTFKKRQEHI